MLQIDDLDGIEKRVLYYAKLYSDLTYAKDKNGRLAIDIATKENRKALNSLYLWFGRFKVTESRPIHASDTCFVYRAKDCNVVEQDVNENDGTNEDNESEVTADVAIKLITNKEQFCRELYFRKLSLSDDYVVCVRAFYPILNQSNNNNDNNNMNESDSYGSYIDQINVSAEHPSNISISLNNLKSLSKELAEKLYCIVMPFGDRNLYVTLKQERFAGRDFDEVRHVFAQIVKCVDYLHTKGILHGDLKPLNIVRLGTQWKLIDFDGSCRLREDTVGSKYSSAYVPPEMIVNDCTSNKIFVRSIENKKNDDKPFDLLVADYSYDVWSLGCILYQLCNSEIRPLFLGDQDDNLSIDSRDASDSIWILSQWTSAIKEAKLSKITNVLARNLVSQMLTKDPKKRPTLTRVLSHPFLSNKTVTRLVGESPSYDIFLSYRVASDSNHVKMLYDLLTSKGLKVWWDQKCLEPGVPWKEGFCAGLVSSRTFVCLLSRLAANDPNNIKQNYSLLKTDSPTDNCLLEQRLALELRELGLIEKIFPVFIGDRDEHTGEYSDFFRSGCLPNAPAIVVDSVEADLLFYMDSQALGTPVQPQKTVLSILNDITACQGAFIRGMADVAFRDASDAIVHMLSTPEPEESTIGEEEISKEKSSQTLNEEIESMRKELQNKSMELESKLEDLLKDPKSSAVKLLREVLAAKEEEIRKLKEMLNEK